MGRLSYGADAYKRRQIQQNRYHVQVRHHPVWCGPPRPKVQQKNFQTEITLARHPLTNRIALHYTTLEQAAARQWHRGRTWRPVIFGCCPPKVGDAVVLGFLRLLFLRKTLPSVNGRNLPGGSHLFFPQSRLTSDSAHARQRSRHLSCGGLNNRRARARCPPRVSLLAAALCRVNWAGDLCSGESPSRWGDWGSFAAKGQQQRRARAETWLRLRSRDRDGWGGDAERCESASGSTLDFRYA